MNFEIYSIRDKETKERVFFSLIRQPMQCSKKLIEEAIEGAIGDLSFYDRRTLKMHQEMFVPHELVTKKNQVISGILED